MKFCLKIAACLIFLSLPVIPVYGQEIVEPIREVFNKIKPDMQHTEVNQILKKYSSANMMLGIHERDLIKRSDLWSVHFEYHFDNPFVLNNLVGYNLDIYFVGDKAGCLFFRHSAEKNHESIHRGRFCYLFGGELE